MTHKGWSVVKPQQNQFYDILTNNIFNLNDWALFYWRLKFVILYTFRLVYMCKWATTWENVPSDMCLNLDLNWHAHLHARNFAFWAIHYALSEDSDHTAQVDMNLCWVYIECWVQDWRKSDGCFSPNLISSPWRHYEDYNISFCKQWKFRCHCSYEQWHLNLHCLQRGPSCP